MAVVELQNYATVHEISNQQSEKQSFPNTNLDRLGKTGRCLRHLFCTTLSLLRLRTILDSASRRLSQRCDSCAAAFCCRDVGPNGPNNKHILEEHLWHVASTTSTVASLRVARLGWLPSQAILPLHDGCRGTPKLCHCS